MPTSAPTLSSETAFYNLLEWLRSNPGARNETRDMGTNFEKLCVWFLKNDPCWSAQLSDVALVPGKDLGVDLVARNRESSGNTAIQQYSNTAIQQYSVNSLQMPLQ